MNKVDRIMIERCIKRAKNRNQAIEYGESFGMKVNSYKINKNNKIMDRGKIELTKDKVYGE